MFVNSRTMWRLSHDAHGFTLIETLVAMIAGVVLTGAMMEIFVVSLHQTSRITDSVQATQLGRTAMTHVVDELHSACISREFKPVQAASGEKELIFENAYSKEAVIPKAYEHQIVWNETTSTLTDFTYESKVESGSEWPSFKFPALDYSSTTHEAANAEPKKGVLIASNVTKTSSATPVFQYYEYGEEYTSSSSTPLSTLKKMTPPSTGFSATEANKAAAVLVSFTTAPVDKETALSRSAEFSNLVTFSFSTPSSEAKISDGPCE
jgi:Tfp pilus assembly protein PilW